MFIKKNLSEEELKHNLPDYINNNISDPELHESISRELEFNDGLKKELEEIKEAFGFIDNSEFSAPPDNYFANLSVKINEKIQGNENELSWWERPGLLWKILIPVIPAAVIIIFILFNFYNNESSKTGIANEIPVNKSIQDDQKNDKISDAETGLKKETPEKETPEKETASEINNNKTTENKKQSDFKNRMTVPEKEMENNQILIPDKTNKLKNTDLAEENENNTTELMEENSDFLNNDLIAENLDIDFGTDIDSDIEEAGADFFNQTDLSEDKAIEEEFQNLSREEQNEILSNLKSY